jgi:hypothetical protein
MTRAPDSSGYGRRSVRPRRRQRLKILPSPSMWWSRCASQRKSTPTFYRARDVQCSRSNTVSHGRAAPGRVVHAVAGAELEREGPQLVLVHAVSAAVHRAALAQITRRQVGALRYLSYLRRHRCAPIRSRKPTGFFLTASRSS